MKNFRKLTGVFAAFLLIFTMTVTPISANDGFPTGEDKGAPSETHDVKEGRKNSTNNEKQTQTQTNKQNNSGGYDVLNPNGEGTAIDDNEEIDGVTEDLKDVYGGLGLDSIEQVMDTPLAQTAMRITSLIVNLLLVAIIAWMAIGTILDIAVIFITPLRKYLVPQNAQSSGMGMGGMGGMGRQQQVTKIQWISPEAIQIIQATETQGGRGGMGGMPGMGMGMSPAGAQQQASDTPSPFKTYLKMRSKTFIYLIVAILILVFNTIWFDVGALVAKIIITIITVIIEIIKTIKI